jgi:hypothetical protein
MRIYKFQWSFIGSLLITTVQARDINLADALGIKDVDEVANHAGHYDISFDQHQIGVNQIGYFWDRPKRFTAPLTPNKTDFRVREKTGTVILYIAMIKGGIGDFTSCQPHDSNEQYVIDISGGELNSNTSDPLLFRKKIAHYSR